MMISGTFAFHGPRTAVWELLQDPEVLARVLPGTQVLRRAGPDAFEGTMHASVGPVTAAEFAVRLTLADQVPPERLTLRLEGKGSVGFAHGSASMALAESDAGTVMTYSSDVHVGGRIAAVGQRLIESVARTMLRQALAALDRELQARRQPAP
jgi:hypothetical protein